jgi:hypothetical protein
MKRHVLENRNRITGVILFVPVIEAALILAANSNGRLRSAQTVLTPNNIHTNAIQQYQQ